MSETLQNTTIENPVINSPFEEPQRHYEFTDTGISNKIVPGRRKSVFFIPIAKPKQRSAQVDMNLDGLNTTRPNELINRLRDQIAPWRQSGYRGVSYVTRQLLHYWSRPGRERRLFFCQLEALETVIYITEVARSDGAVWIENELAAANRNATPEGWSLLLRYALKMATGSGKTVLMAMIIAWQTLNKLANRQSKKFSDAFIIVAPGITIRDRLQVLLPNNPNNYYQSLDLVPAALLDELGKAKIIITNFHSFMLREKVKTGKLTKTVLGRGDASLFKETEGQMVARVCKALGNKKGVIILNDEAHHCYHRNPNTLASEALGQTQEIFGKEEKLKGDDRKEAEHREQEARIWISGLEAVQKKLGVRGVFDLSATPFFLKGSGYGEGTLFPWVVSDFSMTDAIECGIVKVPRVPVADNTADGSVKYRNLWSQIRSDLPKGRRSKQDENTEPAPPKELESALHSLYSSYEKYYQQWQEQVDAGAMGVMPPVFIVVCNNTRTSKMLFDYIAGWEETRVDADSGQETSVLHPGKLKIFSNVDERSVITERAWTTRPNTLLIDSQQLESGEALTPEFRKAAQREVDEFKAEYRARFPGSDTDKLTDEDVLREVMNTVGKPGKLGERIKCVVSVSMLTEGWNTNTVTHILGVRAFGTQLLCEQVIGRGLRRISYETEPHTVTEGGSVYEFEAFPAEYTEVYGVPFDFMPTSKGGGMFKPQKEAILVQSLEERKHSAIQFPRLAGYRYELPEERLPFAFDERSRMLLTTKDVPTMVEIAPIVGETDIHTLDDLRRERENKVAFMLAKTVLEKYFRQDKDLEYVDFAIGERVQNDVKPWLFPQVLDIAKRWLRECLSHDDHTFPQMLLLKELLYTAAGRIYTAIVAGATGNGSADGDGDAANAGLLKPIFHPYSPLATTDGVNFLTRKATYTTNEKCHLSHVTLDSTWERQVAQAFEHMDEVAAYVKNDRLDFEIPYTYEGRERRYLPDFVVRIDDACPNSRAGKLNLIVEVSGEARDDKAAKTDTIEKLWVPAVNNARRFGRWAFVEITDPYQAMSTIQGFLQGQ